MRIKSLVPVLLISSALLAGCSTAEVAVPGRAPSAAPSATASAADLCQAWSNLTTSVTSLRSINVVTGGVASVQTAVTNIQTQLNAFQAAAKSDFGPQVADFRTSLSAAQKSIQGAVASPGVSALLPLVTSIAGVGTAYNEIKGAVSSRCP